MSYVSYYLGRMQSITYPDYEAFGSILNQNGTKVFTASFTGKMYDAEAGMYYFNARWYDSEIGRFITEDPARDGIDWYAYCNNNPLRYTDPDGRKDDVIIKPAEPSQVKRSEDSFYGNLLPSQNYKQKTFNQNKEQKTLWGEATFVEGPEENSCYMQSGLFNISSELNNSPKNHHIYAQGQLDILNADFSASVTDKGAGAGFDLNALSVAGQIGYQSDNILATIGGSAGFTAGGEIKLDIDKGIFIFDVAVILGVRIEINWKRGEK